jgi:NAD(P)-dependent dehydrogenase (short-subunit alcohol dehydrogenase family)
MRLSETMARVIRAEGQGWMLNISTVAGLEPTGLLIAYAVPKAVITHLTRCMAVADARDGRQLRRACRRAREQQPISALSMSSAPRPRRC